MSFAHIRDTLAHGATFSNGPKLREDKQSAFQKRETFQRALCRQFEGK